MSTLAFETHYRMWQFDTGGGWMTTELIQFDLANGTTVVAEVDAAPGVSRASRDGMLVKATGTLQLALAKVREAADAALAQFQSMARQPDDVEIKFGVKLDAEAGAVIAKTGVEGHFEVKLTWKRGTPSPHQPVQ